MATRGESVSPNPVQIELVDFHDIIESFTQGGSESLRQEFDNFLDEQARAGNSRPLLYIGDDLYSNLSSEGIDLGSVNETVPVRILPQEGDLFRMLSRFSFDEGIKDVLEGKRSLLINPGGEIDTESDGYLKIGEEFAQKAYEDALNGTSDADYLESQRGVEVKELPDGKIRLGVDEHRLGKEFDYDEDGSLSLYLDGREIELLYEDIETAEVGHRYEFVME